MEVINNQNSIWGGDTTEEAGIGCSEPFPNTNVLYIWCRMTPTQIGTETNWSSISVGTAHTAAIRATP